jgi:hypothetical protein
MAEASWMGKLDPWIELEFAQHCVTCPECALELEQAGEFLTMIRGAVPKDSPYLILKCSPSVFRTGSRDIE